jgi:LCP family protein required for cell wall assembly
MPRADRRTQVPSARTSPEGSSGGTGGGSGSDGSSGGGGHQGHGNRRRRAGSKHPVLKWSVIGLSVIVLGTAGGGWIYYQHLNGNIHKDDLTLGRAMPHQKNANGQSAMNILIIGSDSRASKEDQKLGGAKQDATRPPLGDVEMLMHLSADRTNASVISIPRDTRVQIPECKDDGKTYAPIDETINNSLGRGGPGCTVATWYELTHITIDHFMMLDFNGVVKMADAIGGVPVCVDANVYSHDSQGHGSGLKLTKGTHKVMGVQALQWLRTRYGFEDNTDIGRTHAQHEYMNSMFRELTKSAKLTDPGELTKLAEASTRALTVDKDLGTVKKLYDLGNQIKGIPAKRITMTTMPWEWDPANNAHVIPKPGDAEKLFSLVRDDIPLDGEAAKKPKAPPKSDLPMDQIPVSVLNGTGSSTLAPVGGRATQVVGTLTTQGYAKAAADPTAKQQDETTITYQTSKQKGEALEVAKSLGLPTSAVSQSKDDPGVLLVVGADWREGTTYPAAEKKKRDSQGVPDSAAVLRGDNTKDCMHVNSNYTF